MQKVSVHFCLNTKNNASVKPSRFNAVSFGPDLFWQWNRLRAVILLPQASREDARAEVKNEKEVTFAAHFPKCKTNAILDYFRHNLKQH